MNKPIIFAVVGESGTGKTTLVESLEHRIGIKMIESHTDRPPRYEGERGHTFWSKEEFDQFDPEDMIAYTNFGDRRYCCVKSDVLPVNTYVIDEPGLDWLLTKFKNEYIVFGIRIIRDAEKRLESGVDSDRIARDKGKFTKLLNKYDLVIDNSGNIQETYKIFEDFVTSTLNKTANNLNHVSV